MTAAVQPLPLEDRSACPYPVSSYWPKNPQVEILARAWSEKALPSLGLNAATGSLIHQVAQPLGCCLQAKKFGFALWLQCEAKALSLAGESKPQGSLRVNVSGTITLGFSWKYGTLGKHCRRQICLWNSDDGQIGAQSFCLVCHPLGHS